MRTTQRSETEMLVNQFNPIVKVEEMYSTCAGFEMVFLEGCYIRGMSFLDCVYILHFCCKKGEKLVKGGGKLPPRIFWTFVLTYHFV